MDKLDSDRPGGDPKTDIHLLRRAIDGIDAKILDLINQRLSLAKQIGAIKKQDDLQITDTGREEEILNRLLEKNKGPMTPDGLRNIFEAIIAEGRNMQRTR